MDIKLKPNGWHRRLQTFVFGKDCPLYHNFCPYFWLTNFCILITFLIPIVPLVKLIILVCGGISIAFEKAGDYFEDVICKPRFERSALNMDPELLLRSWTLYDEEQMNYEDWDGERFKLNRLFRHEIYESDYKLKSKKREEMRKKFEVWKTKTPNWQQILDEHKAKKIVAMEQWKLDLAEQRVKTLKQQQEDARREELAKIRRQKMFTWIVTNTKWIVYPILACGALYILYWIGIGAINLWNYTCDHFYYDRFISVMKMMGYGLMWIIPAATILFFLVKTLSRVMCASTFCFCNTWLSKYILNFLAKYLLFPLWKSIKWLAIGIGKGIGNSWEYIMIFKSNYCPGINWTDEKK